MHFPVEGTWKTLLFFTVLTSWTIAFGETEGDKTLNLRIGFDLTQGTNGAPALRIRDFEDTDKSENEGHPTTEEQEEVTDEPKVSPAIRADSFSDEEEKGKQDETSIEEETKSSDESEDGNESGNTKHRSTKGLRPAEYEPEDNPKIHGRYQEDDDESESDNEARRQRNKREIDFKAMKRKSKKFRSARKQVGTRA